MFGQSRSLKKHGLAEAGNSPVGRNKNLFSEIRQLIESARHRAAAAVNFELTLLYWRIGVRIRKEILKEKRADYGDQIVVTLSRQLTSDYGNGYSEKNLWRMVQFAKQFPKEEIVVTLSQQLGWSHFVTIFPVSDPLARDFYAELCRLERWSVRELRGKIAGMLFERTAIAKKPEIVIKKELSDLHRTGRVTPDLVFRDPYILDFLRLNGAYSEKDLESMVLRELESFVLELGSGFSFTARQKRITVDGEDYYLDLLFYHRYLHRLVAVELKLGKFKAEYKGQMELYLRWLDKYERRSGEAHPLGLILCAGKSDEQVELLELNKSGIRIATYLTALPPRKILQEKLHTAVQWAREHLENLEAK